MTYHPTVDSNWTQKFSFLKVQEHENTTKKLQQRHFHEQKLIFAEETHGLYQSWHRQWQWGKRRGWDDQYDANMPNWATPLSVVRPKKCGDLERREITLSAPPHKIVSMKIMSHKLVEKKGILPQHHRECRWPRSQVGTVQQLLIFASSPVVCRCSPARSPVYRCPAEKPKSHECCKASPAILPKDLVDSFCAATLSADVTLF